MKSFDRQYLEHLAVPHRLIATIRQIGEYKGRQELYKQQKETAGSALDGLLPKQHVL